MIPGLGISAREGIGYTLQYCWASLAAQLVKSPPAMWVRPWFIPWVGKIPLGKGKATHSSILAWRIPQEVSLTWSYLAMLGAPMLTRGVIRKYCPK